jgi:hypothetical protein
VPGSQKMAFKTMIEKNKNKQSSQKKEELASENPPGKNPGTKMKTGENKSKKQTEKNKPLGFNDLAVLKLIPKDMTNLNGWTLGKIQRWKGQHLCYDFYKFSSREKVIWHL